TLLPLRGRRPCRSLLYFSLHAEKTPGHHAKQGARRTCAQMCASTSRLRLFAAHRLDVHLERQLDVLRQAAPAHSFVASELPIQKTIVKTRMAKKFALRDKLGSLCHSAWARRALGHCEPAGKWGSSWSGHASWPTSA